MKARVIVNPQANKGNCARRWPQIKAELEKNMGSLSQADVVVRALAALTDSLPADVRKVVQVLQRQHGRQQK